MWVSVLCLSLQYDSHARLHSYEAILIEVSADIQGESKESMAEGLCTCIFLLFLMCLNRGLLVQ